MINKTESINMQEKLAHEILELEKEIDDLKGRMRDQAIEASAWKPA